MIPLNPFDQRARPNPYPVYDYMRTVEPVHHSPVGFWILTRYDDCRAVLEDPRWSHDADHILEPQRGASDPVDATVRLLRASIAFADPPHHARHRRPIEAVLKGAVRGLAPRTQKVARDLITLMREKGGAADLVRDYAAALPTVVMSDLFGFPAGDRPHLQRWGRELAAGLDPDLKVAKVVSAGAAAAAMVEYIVDALDSRQDGVEDGVISALRSRTGRLRAWEVVADVATVFVMGVETSRNLIGNAMLAMLRQSDQLEALVAQPALIESGVEEMIRFDGPLHLTARVAKEDVAVGGETIKAGDQALVLLAAANRDPAKFADPHRLQLARADNPHLGFGAGAHACFAAPMARLLCRTAITSLVTELRGMELAGEPAWSDTVVMRGLSSLKIAFAS